MCIRGGRRRGRAGIVVLIAVSVTMKPCRQSGQSISTWFLGEPSAEMVVFPSSCVVMTYTSPSGKSAQNGTGPRVPRVSAPAARTRRRPGPRCCGRRGRRYRRADCALGLRRGRRGASSTDDLRGGCLLRRSRRSTVLDAPGSLVEFAPRANRQCGGDLRVAALCGVLVAQRGAGCRVSEPRHQLGQCGARASGQRRPCVGGRGISDRAGQRLLAGRDRTPGRGSTAPGARRVPAGNSSPRATAMCALQVSGTPASGAAGSQRRGCRRRTSGASTDDPP